MDNKYLLRLALCRMPFLTLREKKLLENKLDTIDDLALLSKKELSEMVGRVVRSTLFKPDTIQKRIERDCKIMHSFHIGVVFLDEKKYPSLLKEVYKPPYALFYRGNAEVLSMPSVGVVGTRRATGQGRKHAMKFSKELAEQNYCVVSGLAFGIDAAAHTGALSAKIATTDGKGFSNGKTVAILGSGPDVIRPALNGKIASQILEKGGCIASEYPPEEKPQKWHYPQRNRIISGLSQAITVIEAPPASGALITADFAIEQNRDLFFHSRALEYEQIMQIPVNPANSKKALSMRVSKYVNEGAPVVNSAGDVLTLLKKSNESKIVQQSLDFGDK
ncbi:MAG: DNA protecting protein DprA [Treponema sp. CETP13]|nr:MAG: DNA protecting protein DprA [Treponema sp. CETP13]